MAKVTGVLCHVITYRIDRAGTDSSVYIDLWGENFD